jgi:hypothetical protein
MASNSCFMGSRYRRMIINPAGSAEEADHRYGQKPAGAAGDDPPGGQRHDRRSPAGSLIDSSTGDLQSGTSSRCRMNF